MGHGHTKFNKLEYPSYCTLEPATHDDRIICFETWSRAVRTRTATDDFPLELVGKKSFDVLHLKFESYLRKQGVTEALPDDFLICLVSTIIHGKLYRAPAFRGYNLTAATWSAVGTALFMSLLALHEPFPWNSAVQTAWTRGFGDLMRAILKTPTFGHMSPTANRMPIPQYPRRPNLRITIPSSQSTSAPIQRELPMTA